MQRRRRKQAENPLAARREALKALPQVGRLLESRPLMRLAPALGGELLTGLVRREVARLRERIISGQLAGSALARAIRTRGQVEPVFVDEPFTIRSILEDVVVDDDIVAMLGAGNIGQLAEELVA